LCIGDAARLGEDLLGVAACLLDQGAVLLQQLAGFGPRLVRLLDRLADPLAASVDHLLDRSERVTPQDEKRQSEADERPDHEAGSDLDEGVGGDDCVHQTRTNASSPPIRP
jgi:hypothetical protein